MKPELYSSTRLGRHFGLVMLRGNFDVTKTVGVEVYCPDRLDDGRLWMLRDLSEKAVTQDLESAYLQGAAADVGKWRAMATGIQMLFDQNALVFQFVVDPVRCVAVRVRQEKEVSNPLMINRPEIWFVREQHMGYAPGEKLSIYGSGLSVSHYESATRCFLESPSSKTRWELRCGAAFGEDQGPTFGITDCVVRAQLPDDLPHGTYDLFVVTNDRTLWGVSNKVRIEVNSGDYDADVETTFVDPYEPLQPQLDEAGEAYRATGKRQHVGLPAATYSLRRPLVVPPGVSLFGQNRNAILTAGANFSAEWETPPWQGCPTLDALVLLQDRSTLQTLSIQSIHRGGPAACVAVWNVAAGPGGGKAHNIGIMDCRLETLLERREQFWSPPHAAAGILLNSPTEGLTILYNDVTAMEAVQQLFGAAASDFIVAKNHFRPGYSGRVGVTAFGGVWGVRGVIEHNHIEDSNRGLVAQSWAGPVRQMVVVGNVVRGSTCNYGQGESCLLEFVDAGPGKIDTGSKTYTKADRPYRCEAQAILFSEPLSEPAPSVGASVLVLSGPGRGQCRTVASRHASGAGYVLDRPWDVVPTPGESRILIGNIPTDLLFFRNRYENSKGGLMLNGCAYGVTSIGDEWFHCADGVYLDSAADTAGIFNVTVCGPTLVDSAFTMQRTDGPAAFKSPDPVISGVVLDRGEFVRSPIYWAASCGVEGLLATELNATDRWGRPGYPYVGTAYRGYDQEESSIPKTAPRPMLVPRWGSTPIEKPSVFFSRCHVDGVDVSLPFIKRASV